MRADSLCADFISQDSDDDPHAEIDRLRADNSDLRASALRWKELYEAAVAGTKDISAGAVARHAGRRSAIPVEVSVNVTTNDDGSGAATSAPRVRRVAL